MMHPLTRQTTQETVMDNIDITAVLAGNPLNESQLVMAEFAIALSRFHNVRAKNMHDRALDKLWARMARLKDTAAADASDRRKMAEIVADIQEQLFEY